jgi:hypothetical protein
VVDGKAPFSVSMSTTFMVIEGSADRAGMAP